MAAAMSSARAGPFRGGGHALLHLLAALFGGEELLGHGRDDHTGSYCVERDVGSGKPFGGGIAADPTGHGLLGGGIVEVTGHSARGHQLLADCGGGRTVTVEHRLEEVVMGWVQ